jgi:hypothetical protein
MGKYRNNTKQNFLKRPDGVVVLSGGNMSKVRIGHQYAVPTTTPDGQQVLQTPTGQKFKVTRMK